MESAVVHLHELSFMAAEARVETSAAPSLKIARKRTIRPRGVTHAQGMLSGARFGAFYGHYVDMICHPAPNTLIYQIFTRVYFLIYNQSIYETAEQWPLT